VKTPDSNSATHWTLARRVAEQILGVSADEIPVIAGPLEVNYFSFTFFLDAGTAENRRRLFVKIPKNDLRGRSAAILPVSGKDRRMAEDEAHSLSVLAKEWQADELDVYWVRLRAVVPDFNAVVTDRIDAVEAFTVFRRLDLQRRLGFREDARKLRRAMSRFGAALARFHHRNATRTVFQLAKEIPKWQYYCREIGSSPFGPRGMDLVGALDGIADMKFDAIEVSTLKGIDIRNMLIDEQDRMFLLDPGRLKRACREADLARFITTYRILYWGSVLFALGLSPDPNAEAAFINAYYTSSSPPSARLMSLFVLKEQLKHWHTAIYSLEMLPWSAPIKSLVAASYINPYYKREMAKALKRVVE
jgi:hypothetical protein